MSAKNPRRWLQRGVRYFRVKGDAAWLIFLICAAYLKIARLELEQQALIIRLQFCDPFTGFGQQMLKPHIFDFQIISLIWKRIRPFFQFIFVTHKRPNNY